MDDSPELTALFARLEAEEAAYAAALAAVDALARLPPTAPHPELPEVFERVNRLWQRDGPHEPGGAGAKVRRWV